MVRIGTFSVVLLVLAGCSELATDGAEGADCVRSSQCQPGLACVPVAPDASQRMCSGDPGDLMGEVPEIDGGLEGGMVVADGGADGGPADSGATSMDSGTGGSDSGSMSMDSGTGGSDSGTGGSDSGSGSSDAAAD
ncbi:MAG: hypothetical protein ACOCUS_06725 [Polyangiales bacterium]